MGTMEVEEDRQAEAEDLEESSDEEEEEEEEEEDDDEDDEEEQVEVDESELDWIEWGSEEEEDAEDEDTLRQQTLPAGSRVGISFSLNCKQASDDEKDAGGDDEEDSDWSDDDDDSEASAESVELWESFLHSGDPYNPLSSSCTPVSRNTPASAARGVRRAEEEEEEEEEREDGQHSTHSAQQNKKVRFSDELTVRPLVAWAFASKAARNGSCWMEMARDRDRFRRRVEDAGKVISPCLSHDHRRLVWERLQQQSAQ
ncbi:hypothetical protein AALO_G00302920 [Alosa alosa]|uniref:Protein phosphatase 1 regulatory subunit 15A n=1 Tax=Alosa alosa TaxID=278164 RepID=A0AAV6FEX6_9TELE|nr:protein phosphatase 1 regulatory subunit 15A [Alosa alosa]KAG5261343.1 hypothetical protein AALO_G00302920 [Alosa alosa]